MPKNLKDELIEHLENLLQFWWDEYDRYKRGVFQSREDAAAALRQYRRARRTHAVVEATPCTT